MLILAGNGTAFLYSSADDDFVAARSVIPTPIAGYYGPIAAGPERPVLSGERPGVEPGPDAHRLFRYRPGRRRRIACSGRSVFQRTASRGGGCGRRIDLCALQYSSDGRQRNARGHGPRGGGGCEHLAHHRYGRGARNHFDDCTRGSASERRSAGAWCWIRPARRRLC